MLGSPGRRAQWAFARKLGPKQNRVEWNQPGPTPPRGTSRSRSGRCGCRRTPRSGNGPQVSGGAHHHRGLGAAAGTALTAAGVYSVVALGFVEIPLISHLTAPAKTCQAVAAVDGWVKARRQQVFGFVIAMLGFSSWPTGWATDPVLIQGLTCQRRGQRIFLHCPRPRRRAVRTHR